MKRDAGLGTMLETGESFQLSGCLLSSKYCRNLASELKSHLTGVLWWQQLDSGSGSGSGSVIRVPPLLRNFASVRLPLLQFQHWVMALSSLRRGCSKQIHFSQFKVQAFPPLSLVPAWLLQPGQNKKSWTKQQKKKQVHFHQPCWSRTSLAKAL